MTPLHRTLEQAMQAAALKEASMEVGVPCYYFDQDALVLAREVLRLRAELKTAHDWESACKRLHDTDPNPQR